MTDKFGRAISGSSTSTNTGVTKSYVRANYIESSMEEDIDMKNQFKIKNLPNPTNLQDPATKHYVDSKTNNLVSISELDNNSIVRNNKNNNFNGNTITGLESVYVNRDPNFPLELSTKQYTDDSIDEQSILRLHKDEKLQLAGKDFITLESNLTTPKTILYIPLNTNLVRRDRDNEFDNHSLYNVSSISVTSQAVNDNELVSKAYVDSFHQENERTRRDVGLEFYDEANDLVKNNQNNDFNNNEITNVKSIQINDDPVSLQDATNKIYVDTTIDEFSIVRNNQDNDLNNNQLTNIKSIEINDAPINDNHVATKQYVDSKSGGLKQDPNITLLSSSDLIPILINTMIGEVSFPIATKKYVDKRVFYELQIMTKFTNNNGAVLWTNWDLEISSGMNSLTGFFKSSNSRTGSSGTGPDFLPPIGEYYAYIETSSPNYGPDRYAIAKYSYHANITRIKFWYHKLGVNMCRFRLQYETLDYQWVDKVIFPAKEQTSGWVFLEETFSEDNRGIRFYFDEISSYESDMAFSDITIDYHSPK